jgi:aquaporin Z
MGAMLRALREHWPEYLCEAFGLGVFMVSACSISVLLEYPGSPARQALPNADLRRAFFGVGMGFTAMGIVYSPPGQRSGAHINPAVTLAFLYLRKIAAWDAVFYMPAQLLGGVLGVLLSWAIFPHALAHPAVRFVVTVPGDHGVLGALLTELLISFVTLSVVLVVASIAKLASYAGVATGVIVSLNVYFAAPLSGFGMNPARSLSSALVANVWTAWWVYVFAPPLAMLAAAELHARTRARAARTPCAARNFITVAKLPAFFVAFSQPTQRSTNLGSEPWRFAMWHFALLASRA